MRALLWFLAGGFVVGVVGSFALAVWLDRTMRGWF